MKNGAALLAAALLLSPAADAAGGQDKKGAKRGYGMGLGLFPYEFSIEGVTETQKFITSHSDVMSFTVKDGGIPWEPALADAAFPGGIETKWKEARDGVPAGCKVFLAITPLNDDKNGLHKNRTEQENQPLPDTFKGKPFDDRSVIKAYANYCKRAINAHKPDWVSIAIDCTGPAYDKPREWEALVRLIRAVREAIKKDNPRLPVGVTHELPMLWNQTIARTVQPSLRDLDFLGLSFMPFVGPLAEKGGGRSLPTGKEQWLGPLKWVRKYTNLPIAICAAGYTTKDVVVPIYEIKLKGDIVVQRDFLTGLLEHAEKDDYLFVIWSVPIDLEKLLAGLPSDIQGFLKIIQNVGLLDGQLKPKPALEVWDRELLRNPKPQ